MPTDSRINHSLDNRHLCAATQVVVGTRLSVPVETSTTLLICRGSFTPIDAREKNDEAIRCCPIGEARIVYEHVVAIVIVYATAVQEHMEPARWRS